MLDQMEKNILLGEFDKEKLQERIAKFKGGIAVIKAGGGTSIVMNECRDRIEDAVFAVRAAF
jgi:chaperonin GroEL